MKTFSFIGSDKNAGKTTALNFVVQKLQHKKQAKLLLTSIGINGEKVDQYDYHLKPAIIIPQGQFFLTAKEHLQSQKGLFTIQEFFSIPSFKKDFVLGKALINLPLVLEGPNDKSELLKLKNVLKKKFKIQYLLIDGSIDRQFIGHPEVSDAFYFSLLISQRAEQLQKAKDLVAPLNFELCSKKLQNIIGQYPSETKGLLLDEKGNVLYVGNKMVFADEELQKLCLNTPKEKRFLYLNSSLSKRLANTLSPLKHLTVILNNFTLYQNVHVKMNESASKFNPCLQLLHPVKVAKIFLREQHEQAKMALILDKKIKVHNLFRENIHEIRI